MAALASRLDNKLIEDASRALIKFEQKRNQEKQTKKLIDERPNCILLQVQLQKEIAHDNRKPIRVKIPHSLFSADLEHSICLFIRDDQKERIETELSANPVAGLDKIMTISDVRKYCKEYQNRKKLLSEHDFFLCHHSIGRQLYNLLGKDFGARNHFPIQVSYPELNKLAKVVRQAVDSTYMHKAGRNMTIKIGLTSMSSQSIRQNIVDGMEFAIQKLSHGWRDVHSLHLKTKDSASLPIYSATDDELLNYVKAKIQEKSTDNSKAVAAVEAKSTAAAKKTSKASEEVVAVEKKKKRKEEEAEVVVPPVPTPAKKKSKKI